jgi:ribosomal-protein-alanine N-acetyltransferase
MAELRTARLLLRQWRRDDLKPFAALNADPEVMRYFPAPLSRRESDGLARTAHALIEARGWGLWAVEVVETRLFIGFIGLAEPRFEADFSPAVEVGWRLHRCQWGRGYATEGARAALAYAFDELSLKEVVSFTSAVNLRSRRVMERLGMIHDPRDDFDHPLVDDPVLRPHVLYRIRGRADHHG